MLNEPLLKTDVSALGDAMADGDRLKGRQHSVEQMARRHNGSLLRFFRRSLPSTEDAEDMTQEVYARLSKTESLDDIQHSKKYIFRVAINLLRDRMRYRQVHHADEQIEYNDKLQSSEAPQADRIIEGKQKLAVLKEAVQALPPKCRDVFILHRTGGMTYRQIGKQLDIAESTVEKHMIRAIAQLKKAADGLNDE